MATYRYRSKSRFIAFVDLVLTSMTLLIPLFVLLSAVGFTAISQSPKLQEEVRKAITNAKEDNPNKFSDSIIADDDQTFEGIATMLYIMFFIVAIVVIIQLVAAVKLINATQLGIDAMGAAQRARFWRNCTIVFTVLCVLAGLKPSTPFEALFNWMSVLLRCIGIYVVHQFILELDSAAKAGILPNHHGTTVPLNTGMAYAYIPPQSNNVGLNPPNYAEVVKEKI